nr:katanin-interacting protein-like isoform X3 [Panthera onca]
MVPDFDEKHDEYLILLQQRNRILKHLRSKDPMQLRLEHLEQGFSVYVNGANSELKTSPRKAVHPDFTRSASHAEGTHDYGRRTLFREAEEALRRNSRTAPSKVQRRGWHQKSVQIRTEAGPRLHIEPPLDPSEDFEPCGDVTVKAKDASGDRPQGTKSPTGTTPCDFNVSLLNAHGLPDPASSADKERILLTIQDVMWPYQFACPPAVQQTSHFSTSSTIFVVSCVFDISHSDRYEAISHCGFDLHFPDE